MPTKKKAKIGRPNMGLSEIAISFRLPADLKDQVDAAARKAGIPISEWWRQAAQARLEGKS